MKTLYLIGFLLILMSVVAYSQPEMKLSDRHMSKVLAQDNPVKKRGIYLRYFHKDSIRHVKEVDRFWQAKLDSSNTWVSNRKTKLIALRDKILATTKNSANQMQSDFFIDKETYRMPVQVEMLFKNDVLKAHYEITREFLIESSKDTFNVISDFNFRQFALANKIPQLNKTVGNLKLPLKNKRLNGLKAKGKGLADINNNNNETLAKAKELSTDAGQYLGEYQKYVGYTSMSSDSLKQIAVARFEKEAQHAIMSSAEFKGYQKEMTQFTAMQNQYKSQLNDLNDSTARKEMLKQKAEELAMQYIQDNPGVLQAAQKKMDLLMKKYSSVVNSNDLSTAVKRTSLKGRTFRERLVIAGNFQMISLQPVSVDFSPQIGYRFNSQLSIGVGGMYRQTFNDSIQFLSPTVLGYKSFVSYDVIRSFFAYGEYGQNSPGVKIEEGISTRIWKAAALLGVGRKFSISKKIDMTVVALYNFLHEPGDPVYPRPFMVRFGFQLSDIALLKRKPDVKLF